MPGEPFPENQLHEPGVEIGVEGFVLPQFFAELQDPLLGDIAVEITVNVGRLDSL